MTLEDQFRELHKALVEHLITRVANDPSGEVLKQARELLRDNGITDAGRSEAPIKRLQDLVEGLPFKAVL